MNKEDIEVSRYDWVHLYKYLGSKAQIVHGDGRKGINIPWIDLDELNQMYSLEIPKEKFDQVHPADMFFVWCK